MKKTILILVMTFLVAACSDAVEKYDDGLYENGTFYFYGGETATGTLDKGKRAGIWTFYDKNKNLAAKGNYVDGKEDGPWKFWYDNGKMQREGAYLAGLQHGHWKTFYTDESLESEGDFKQGKQTGVWQFFYTNAQRRASGTMEEDKRVGRWEFFYNNGEPKEIRVYEGETNKLLSSWTENGTAMVVNGNGKYEYWDYGLLRERGAYKDGKMEGQWTFWDENGTVTSEGFFVDGEKVGEVAPQ